MRIEALANPKLLIWARQTAGLEVADAARKARLKPEALVKWEAGERRPTITQLRRLADVYKRILGVFYLNEPPQAEQSVHVFREPGSAGVARASRTRNPRMTNALKRAFVAASKLSASGQDDLAAAIMAEIE